MAQLLVHVLAGSHWLSRGFGFGVSGLSFILVVGCRIEGLGLGLGFRPGLWIRGFGFGFGIRKCLYSCGFGLRLGLEVYFRTF